jgi:hypothetical protein
MPTISTKSVAERLKIKPNAKVAIVNAPEDYATTLGKVPNGAIVRQDANAPSDVIQVFVQDAAELQRELPKLLEKLNPGGALWVSYYKGTSKKKSDISRDTIWEYAKTIGLDAVAIINIDDDWSALRLKAV